MRTAPFELISIEDLQAAGEMLERLELLDSGEAIESMQRAGEGNMNLVIRVVTPRRSMILKQSRPWVEKYPQIEAPADRILAEIDFYQRAEGHQAIHRCMPKMLGCDQVHHVMVLEDLGEASDYSDLYSLRDPQALPLEEAIAWLANLHAIKIQPAERARIGSRLLRELNHEHIFVIPLQTPSAISLDSICQGLEDLAEIVRGDANVLAAAKHLGERYLGSGEQLLHGDFYPGSWLRTIDGLRVIDPEFSFAGPAEFDLGVLAAHRVFVGGGGDSASLISDVYQAAGGKPIDGQLLRGFAAMEIIRRLIGVAQLPLLADQQQRSEMIRIAQRWLDA